MRAEQSMTYLRAGQHAARPLVQVLPLKSPIGGAENIVATCWNSRAARKASVVVLRAKRALVLVIDCRHKCEDHANYHVATTLLVVVMYACCWRNRRLRSVSMLLDNQWVSGNFCCENQK